jgi:hypothetical protein
MFVSRPSCSNTLAFLLSQPQDLVTEVNNSEQGKEGETELILQDTPTAMAIVDMKLVPLLSPSR